MTARMTTAGQADRRPVPALRVTLLHAYSMITLAPQTVTLHRLVQAVARLADPADPHRTPDAISQARARAETILLESLSPSPLFNVDTWPRWRELLPHALALTALIGPEQDTPITASILVETSSFQQGDGHYDQVFSCQRGGIILLEEGSPMAEETRRKFDRDFREGAVRLVRETGKPVARVARDLVVRLRWENAELAMRVVRFKKRGTPSIQCLGDR